MLGARMQMAAAGAGGDAPFDPLSIGWHTAFWAEGSEFEALGLSDSDPVSSWPDEAATHDASQATGTRQPIYRASVAALNGQPGIEFDTSDDYLQTAAFTEISQPHTIVSVVRFTTTGQSRGTGAVAHHGIASGKRAALFQSGAGNMGISAGTAITGGGQDTLAHLYIAEYGATDTLAEDGTTIISGDAGAEGLTGLTLGAGFNIANFLGGYLAFLGLYDGTLTAQQKSDLLAWSKSHYGTP